MTKKCIVALLVASLALSCVFAGNWDFNVTSGVDFCYEKHVEEGVTDRFLGFPIVLGASYYADGAKLGTYAEVSFECWAKRGSTRAKYTPGIGFLVGVTHKAPITDKLEINARAGLNVCYDYLTLAFVEDPIKMSNICLALESTNTLMYQISENVAIGGGLMASIDFAQISRIDGFKPELMNGFLSFNVAPVANVIVSI